MARVRGALSHREREQGFTLVELLVVITITAILAGIAIPVFLRQRAKGFQADVISSLKSATVAGQAYAVAQGGSYAALDGDDGTLLRTTGYRPQADVLIEVAADDSSMCVLARHSNLAGGDDWKEATLDTSRGAPSASDDCESVPTPPTPTSSPGPLPSLPICDPPLVIPPLCTGP